MTRVTHQWESGGRTSCGRPTRGLATVVYPQTPTCKTCRRIVLRAREQARRSAAQGFARTFPAGINARTKRNLSLGQRAVREAQERDQ